MQTDLKKKTVQGIVWSGIQKYSTMLVQFVSGIVLARLLMPEDYGCIGMLGIFMVVARSFVDGGFGAALIQKKRPTQEDYSTIFYWNMGMSFLMYVILFISAPFIAKFYHIPLLESVLKVQGLILFIYAFNLVQANQLQKFFQFKKIAIVTVITSIVSFAVTILMAYWGYGVWSLVALNILTALIPAISYWIICKWRPSLVFSKKSFRELFSFGFFIYLSQIVRNISNNVQGLLIGRFYNSSTMGYYAKASSTESLASHSISNVMMQVTYPLYAECQDDKKMLIGVIKRLTVSLAYITFPLMLLLIILAKPIFVILYSERWLPCVPFFQVLCLSGLSACLQGVNTQPIVAIGKSKIMFWWTIVKKIVSIMLMITGLLLLGLCGLLIGLVLSSWTAYLINAMLVSHYIGYKTMEQLKNLIPILFLSVIAGGTAFYFSSIITQNMYVGAAFRLVVFWVFYIMGSALFRIEAYTYYKKYIITLLSKVKNSK